MTALKEGMRSKSIRRWMGKAEVGKGRLLCEWSNFESFSRGLVSAHSKTKPTREQKLHIALFPYSIKLFSSSCMENRVIFVIFPLEQSTNVNYLIIIVTDFTTLDCILTHFIFKVNIVLTKGTRPTASELEICHLFSE